MTGPTLGADTGVLLEPAQWRQALTDAIANGFDYPELLVGTDRGHAIELTVRLLDRRWRAWTAGTRLPVDGPAAVPTVASVADLLPGFAFSEREVAEMLGVRFEGGDDCPLMLRDHDGPPPLRQSTPLPARLRTPWPGAAEPGLREGDEGMQRRSGNPSRRRQRPPGIPESWTRAEDPA